MKHSGELFQSIHIFWPLKVYRGQSRWTESSARWRWRWRWWWASTTGTCLSSQSQFPHQLTIRSQSLPTETQVPGLALLKTGCQSKNKISIFTFQAEPSSPPLGALSDLDVLVVNHRGVEAEGGAGHRHHSRAWRHKEHFGVPLSLVMVVS